jgi:hypothetical protein
MAFKDGDTVSAKTLYPYPSIGGDTIVGELREEDGDPSVVVKDASGEERQFFVHGDSLEKTDESHTVPVPLDQISDDYWFDFMDQTGQLDEEGEMQEPEEFSLMAKIEKRDDEKHLVFGWLSVANRKDGSLVIDKQGDFFEGLEDVEKAAYDFVMHVRDGGEMHVRKGVSTMVESFVSTPEKRAAMGIPEGSIPDGWWGGFRVNDPRVWEDVKSGKYSMFSVHGTGKRKSVES